MKCTRCGSADLQLREGNLGCRDCGHWCYMLVKGKWHLIMRLRPLLTSPLLESELSEAKGRSR